MSSSSSEELQYRFDHHPPTNDDVVRAHENIRRMCREVGFMVMHTVPVGREQSLALTKLEEAMFWANAGIARTQLQSPESGGNVPQ